MVIKNIIKGQFLQEIILYLFICSLGKGGGCLGKEYILNFVKIILCTLTFKYVHFLLAFVSHY